MKTIKWGSLKVGDCIKIKRRPVGYISGYITKTGRGLQFRYRSDLWPPGLWQNCDIGVIKKSVIEPITKEEMVLELL